VWFLKIIGGALAVGGGLALKHGYDSVGTVAVDWYSLIGGGVLALIGISLPPLVDRHQATLVGQKTCVQHVKKALNRLGEFFRDGDKHVRVNIMLLTPDKTEIRVHKATAFNMENDGDNDLALPIMSGACGKALRTKSWVLADLTIMPEEDGPDWGLPADKQARIRRGLKTILSVCMFDPDASPEGDRKPPVIGTLQVDSDLPESEIFPDIGVARHVATGCADSVAVLLRAGGLI
jgi:hypothetical protein